MKNRSSQNQESNFYQYGRGNNDHTSSYGRGDRSYGNNDYSGQSNHETRDSSYGRENFRPGQDDSNDRPHSQQMRGSQSDSNESRRFAYNNPESFSSRSYQGQEAQAGWGRQNEAETSSGSSRGSNYGMSSQFGSSYGSGNQETSRKGQFAGTTPKNFKRSDERIYDDICQKLSQEGHFDVSDVEIKVESGEVSLEGNIENRSDKHRIEMLVDSIMGVKDITNNLKIARGSKDSKATSDSESDTSLRNTSNTGKTRSIGSSSSNR